MALDSRQHDIWTSERARRHLDTDNANFARSGLAARLDDVGVVVAVLPAEPRSTEIDLPDIEERIPDRFRGPTGNGVSTLHWTVASADALAKASVRDTGWRGYAAIHRNGGAETGIGSPTRYRDEGSELTMYRLFVLVHAVRITVETQAKVFADPAAVPADIGPFEILVAVPDAAGSVLGGRADGWEPAERAFSDTRCPDNNLLVRVHVDTWPADPEGQTELVVRLGDRICDAFGHTQRLFAPPKGRPNAGVLDPTYA